MIRYSEICKKAQNIEVRPLKLTAYSAWLRGFQEQKESQSQYDEGLFKTDFMTEEWYRNRLKEGEALANKDYSYMLNIFRIKDDASVEYCDITTHMREDFQYARVGYTIHNQFWRQGYAKEAIKALVDKCKDYIY